ncbi:hypothetical protein C8R47DRAFT_1137614 [Mycena vitilis]|nr:hypothetical protein C8R47DRAFT_1137614 [Mycena vitilis]
MHWPRTMHWPRIQYRRGPRAGDFPQDVYSSELLYARRGTAIYHPQPLGRPALDDPIRLKIGDVGFISNNAFVPMFRATEPMHETTPERHYLVPTGFVPLEPTPVESGRYPAGIQCSRNYDTEVIHDGGNSGSLIKERTVIRFAPTAERGAALLTKYPVWHTDTVDEKPFVDYMLKNYKSWVQLCSRTQCLPIDMMFVTGVDVSTYYTTVCYHEVPTVPFTDLIILDAATKAQLSRVEDCEWAYFEPHVLHTAAPYVSMKADAETPEYLQQLEEQHETLATNSVFIRALRFRGRKIIFTDSVRAAKLWLDGVLWPPTANFDPLQPLADYIFSHSIAWFALFGDNDIKQMIGDLEPNEDLRGLLERLRPRVRVDKNLGVPSNTLT